jgi:hypothetical protein
LLFLDVASNYFAFFCDWHDICFTKTKSLSMQKNILVAFILIISVAALSSSFVSYHHPLSSFVPPQTYTGALGYTCNACHSSFPLNSPGGSVTVSGLPTGTYAAGTVYNNTC